MRWKTYSLVAVVLSLAAACGSSSLTSDAGVLCIPGASLACACTNGQEGAQVCKADGSGLGDCVCSGATGGVGGAATGGEGGRGGTAGDAGGRGGMAGSVAGSGGSSAGGANCSGPAGRGGSTGATGGSGGTNPFVEFPTPTAASSPWDITTGPDGNLWFPELLGNNIGRITPSGVITEFPVPTAGASPFAITRASDGNLWFTEQDGNKIGRITTAGVVTEFPIPDANAKPSGIAAGADGRLWFTQRGISGFVGAVTTTGVFSKYPFPSYQVVSATASGITAGPDGALWFTYVVTTSVGGGSRVGRMSTSGEATEFSSPCPDSLTAVGPLSKIVPGPGGNLWFTMENTLASNYIGVSSTSGAITTFEILPSFGASGAPGASLRGIAAGPDGNVWFTEAGFGAVVRMTPSGTMTNIIGRDKTLNPAGITAGPDGNIWFTRSSSIARTAP